MHVKRLFFFPSWEGLGVGSSFLLSPFSFLLLPLLGGVRGGFLLPPFSFLLPPASNLVPPASCLLPPASC